MYFFWLEERKVQLSSPDGGFEICMIVAAVCGKNDLKCVEEEEACLLLLSSWSSRSEWREK